MIFFESFHCAIKVSLRRLIFFWASQASFKIGFAVAKKFGTCFFVAVAIVVPQFIEPELLDKGVSIFQILTCVDVSYEQEPKGPDEVGN